MYKRIYIFFTFIVSIIICCQSQAASSDLPETASSFKEVVLLYEETFGRFHKASFSNLLIAEGVTLEMLTDMNQDGKEELILVYQLQDNAENLSFDEIRRGYRFALWQEEENKDIRKVLSGYLFYSNGGWPCLSLVNYDGQTFILENAADGEEFIFYGCQNGGDWGVSSIMKIDWNSEGDLNYYLDDQIISEEEWDAEIERRMYVNSDEFSMFCIQGSDYLDKNLNKINETREKLQIQNSNEAVNVEYEIAYGYLDSETGILYEELQDTMYFSHEYVKIRGYDEIGNLLWEKQTEPTPRAQIPSFQDIGVVNGMYYYNNQGILTALCLSDGETVFSCQWGGAANSYAFGSDGEIILSGYYGPDFAEISRDGVLINKIDIVDDDYYWPISIRVLDGMAYIEYEGGRTGADGKRFCLVNLEDGSARKMDDEEINVFWLNIARAEAAEIGKEEIREIDSDIAEANVEGIPAISEEVRLLLEEKGYEALVLGTPEACAFFDINKDEKEDFLLLARKSNGEMSCYVWTYGAEAGEYWYFPVVSGITETSPLLFYSERYESLVIFFSSGSEEEYIFFKSYGNGAESLFSIRTVHFEDGHTELRLLKSGGHDEILATYDTEEGSTQEADIIWRMYTDNLQEIEMEALKCE